MAEFTAGVQYNDWKGTSAADNADSVTIYELLDKKKLREADEFLIAMDFSIFEKRGNEQFKPYVNVYLVKGPENYEEANGFLSELKENNEPIPVREVRLELSLNELLNLFKRLNVMLTHRDLPVSGRPYTETNG